MILKDDVIFPKITDVSPEAIDLIFKLLIKDPAKRLGTKSADEIKNHPWFKGTDWEAVY